MEIYKNISGKSGVTHYQIEDNFIIVKFKKPTKSGNTTYKYTYSSVGSEVIEDMKRFALCGSGLNTFISKNKPDYESKS